MIDIRVTGMQELPRVSHLKKQIHNLHVNGRPDLFRPAVEEEALPDFFDVEQTRLILAEENGEAIGYALIQYVDRKANPYMQERHFVHVEEFCVSENHQHRGIGRMLMDAVRKCAKESGYPRIELDVWAFNEGAKQFYEAVGMKPFRYFMEMNADAELYLSE